jgi:hypothetical protein
MLDHHTILAILQVDDNQVTQENHELPRSKLCIGFVCLQAYPYPPMEFFPKGASNPEQEVPEDCHLCILLVPSLYIWEVLRLPKTFLLAAMEVGCRRP